MKKMSIAAVFGCVVALAAFSGMSGASDMGDMVERSVPHVIRQSVFA